MVDIVGIIFWLMSDIKFYVVCQALCAVPFYGALPTEPWEPSLVCCDIDHHLHTFPSSLPYILIIALHSHHLHTFSSSLYIITIAIFSHHVPIFSSSSHTIIIFIHSHHHHTFSSSSYILITAIQNMY